MRPESEVVLVGGGIKVALVLLFVAAMGLGMRCDKHEPGYAGSDAGAER